MIKFETEVGTVYEVDAANKKILRPGMQKWEPYHELSPIAVGSRVAIRTAPVTKNGCGFTITTPVVKTLLNPEAAIVLQAQEAPETVSLFRLLGCVFHALALKFVGFWKSCFRRR